MNFTVELYEKHGYTPLSFIKCLQRNEQLPGYGNTPLILKQIETCLLTIPACLKHARASEVVRDDLRLPYILVDSTNSTFMNYFLGPEVRVSSLFRLKLPHTKTKPFNAALRK